MRVVGYLRISSVEQVEGLSPETQRKALKEAGCVEIYEDLGVSGYKANVRRRGFEELLDAIDRGTVKTVVVNTISRLSRNISDTARLNDALHAVGGTVYDLSTGLDQDPGELTPEILATLARQESRLKSRRQHQVFNEFRAAGKSCSSKAPWGLRLPTRASKLRRDDPPDAQERVIVRDPINFKLARELVQYYLRSSCSIADLLRWSIDHGAPFTARSGLNHWLNHPLVKEHILFPGENQQIAAIKKRYTNGWKRGKQGLPSPFRGLVVCNRCGKPMASANKRQALRCSLDRCGNNKQVRIELVKWAASYALCKASKIASKRLLDSLDTKAPSAEEQALQVQIDALEDAVRRVPDLEPLQRPVINNLIKQQSHLEAEEVSHWRTLSSEFLKDLLPMHWLLIPDDLMPRLFRMLLRAVLVDNGTVTAIEMLDGSKGELPDKWPLINNRGVNWMPAFGISEGADERNVLDKIVNENIDVVNWRGLIENPMSPLDWDEADPPPFWLEPES